MTTPAITISAPVVDAALEAAAAGASWKDPRDVANNVLRSGLSMSNPAWVRRAIADGADVNARFERSGEGDSVWALEFALDTDTKYRAEILADLLRAGADPNKPATADTIFKQTLEKVGPEASLIMMNESRVPLDVFPRNFVSSMIPFSLMKMVRRSAVKPDLAVKVMQGLQDIFERDVLAHRPDLPRHHLWTHLAESASGLQMACEEDRTAPCLRWMLDSPAMGMSKYFREKEASSDPSVPFASNLLSSAVEGGAAECVRILLGHGARIDGKDRLDEGSLLKRAEVLAESGRVVPDRKGVWEVMRATHAARQAAKFIDQVAGQAAQSHARPSP